MHQQSLWTTRMCVVVERVWTLTEEGKELCTNRRVDMTELAESCESLSARSPLPCPPAFSDNVNRNSVTWIHLFMSFASLV